MYGLQCTSRGFGWAVLWQKCGKAEYLDGFNDGAGPAEQATCTQMANRFDLWMEHHASGSTVDSEMKVTKEGRFVTEEELEENPDLETESPYEVDDEHLKLWVEFLRHCGGFEVW